MQFIEYIEYIEMGIHKIESIDSQNIILIKTSTWIDHKSKELLLVSHIPINHKILNTIK